MSVFFPESLNSRKFKEFASTFACSSENKETILHLSKLSFQRKSSLYIFFNFKSIQDKTLKGTMILSA